MSIFKVAPDVQPRNQIENSTCWLSSLEMMFQWKYHKSGSYEHSNSLEWKYERCSGYDYTSEILWKLDASYYLNPENMYKNGIAPQECRETARMLGLYATSFGDEIDAKMLQDMLRRYGPLWISGMWIQGRSHVMVVTGCNAETQKISFINPWKNFSLSETSGFVYWLQDRGSQWINCDASVMYWL
jgi:hypothetical protein